MVGFCVLRSTKGKWEGNQGDQAASMMPFWDILKTRVPRCVCFYALYAFFLSLFGGINLTVPFSLIQLLEESCPVPLPAYWIIHSRLILYLCEAILGKPIHRDGPLCRHQPLHVSIIAPIILYGDCLTHFCVSSSAYSAWQTGDAK